MEKRSVDWTMPSVGYGNILGHALTSECFGSVARTASTMESHREETRTRHLCADRDGARAASMRSSTAPIGASVKTSRRQSHPIGAMPDAPRAINRYDRAGKAVDLWTARESQATTIKEKGGKGKPHKAPGPIGASPPRTSVLKKQMCENRVWRSARASGSMHRDGTAVSSIGSAAGDATHTDDHVSTEWLTDVVIDECDL